MCVPPNTAPEPKLAKGDEWIKTFDLEAFTTDMKKLGDELEKNQGPADVAHLNKMVMWSNACALVGMLTMGFGVHAVPIIALSTFTFTRWTMIAHHTCHGGYDRVHPNKARWHRFKFAIGGLWNRMCDWFDWMMPEAWNVEHNNRHHYCLSEVEDPDLVENNLVDLRDAPVPIFLKLLAMPLIVTTWKWYYYSPNTYKELKLARWRKAGKKIPEGVITSDAVTVRSLFFSGGTPFYSIWEFFSVVIGPYLIIHFFLFPAPLLVIGEHMGLGHDMYISAVKNLFYAELLTNFHGFVAVVTNHAGDDMYRFRDGCRPHSGSFYLRQVLASVDFWTGSDINDFLHGYLNYQIEHHMWPSLSMLSYKRSQPLVKALCKKHGVPYVQQNVFWRVKKTVDIMTGAASMKWFPEHYERKFLEIDAVMESQKKNRRTIQLSDKCMQAVQE